MSEDPLYSLRQVIEHINNHLHEPLNIDFLAEQSYFSRSQFQRLFREIMDEPVMEYIKKSRMEQACQALVESHGSILTIALDLGYASQEGFSRAFKAHTGLSPSIYRKTFRVEKHAMEEDLFMENQSQASAQYKRMEIIFNAWESVVKEVELAMGFEDKTPIPDNPIYALVIEDFRASRREFMEFIQEAKVQFFSHRFTVECDNFICSLKKKLDNIDDMIDMYDDRLSSIEAIDMKRLLLFVAPNVILKFKLQGTVIEVVKQEAADFLSMIVGKLDEIIDESSAIVDTVKDKWAESTGSLHKLNLKGKNLTHRLNIYAKQWLTACHIYKQKDAVNICLEAIKVGKSDENGITITIPAKKDEIVEKLTAAVDTLEIAPSLEEMDKYMPENSISLLKEITALIPYLKMNVKIEQARSGESQAWCDCLNRIADFMPKLEEAEDFCSKMYVEYKKRIELLR